MLVYIKNKTNFILSNKQSEINLHIDGIELVDLYGQNNTHLKLLKENYPNVQINSRGNRVKIIGDKKKAQEVKRKIELMIRILKDKK